MSLEALAGESVNYVVEIASANLDVWEPAMHQVNGYEAYTASSTYTFLDTLSSSLDGVEL
ncbi:Hypothetical protein PHPALM_9214 [Phytophthora palmivora]|uniref:Uncharacterized protein n=1 Tax=Phytophthora palmivora TaxID=4796 RepID=A0A2P4Y7V4_9STRA|nr:Hypothetical protein PHPALM_9214 [Phytophthora palmivora]